MGDIEAVKTLEFTYDNLELLKIISYLIGVVINDIQYMNDISDINNELIEYLDLGNNKKIKKEDLESLCSIIDTSKDIEKYNKEV